MIRTLFCLVVLLGVGIGLGATAKEESNYELADAELEELLKSYNSEAGHAQHREHHKDRHKEEHYLMDEIEAQQLDEELEDANKHVYGYGFGYGINDGYPSANGDYGHAYDNNNYNNAYNVNNKPKEFDIHMDYMFLDYVTLLKYKLWLKKEIQMYNDKLHFVNLFVKMMKKREETAPFDPDEVEIKTYESKPNETPLSLK